MRLRISTAILAVALCAACPGARADGLSAHRIASKASGLSEPIYATAPAGDARLFIVEREGTIRVLKDGNVLSTPFLDISDHVYTAENVGGEGGLLSMAFAPDYAQSGLFYVYYTAPSQAQGSSMQSRVSVFSVAGDPTSDVADPTEHVLFHLDQPNTSNHKGGTIAFRGGFLYLGLGDGGGGGDPNGNAQNNGSLLGKLLRFDPSDQAFTPQIWAKGLRNPFRYSFDSATGDLYIGDVGQDAWEEVDVEPAASQGGLNYGWNVMEGSHCYPPSAMSCDETGLTLPIYNYTHDDGYCAVTGGAVYRGAAIPSIRGQYFFSDYCHSSIRSLVWDGAGGTVGPVVDHTEITPDAGVVTQIVAIGQDGNGELALVSLAGDIFRLVPEPGSAALGLAAVAALAALRRVG